MIQPYQPEIRFSDVDAYGIVHNATYIVYMEQARIHWWRQAVRQERWDWTQIGVLVAHHTIDYVHPVKLGDPLEISCQIGEVGDKSMDVHYKMTCEGRSIATAKTVLVCFDTPKSAQSPFLRLGARPLKRRSAEHSAGLLLGRYKQLSLRSSVF